MEGKDQIVELKNIFEHEIKRKLSERARFSADEYRILMNGFKFYDYAYTGKVNENEFVKSILRTGLSGFNESDIRSLFKCYDKNNVGKIDYKNYCAYLCGREELIPLPEQQNKNNNEGQNTNIEINNINNTKEPQLIQKQKTPIQNRKTPLTQQENSSQINPGQPIKSNQIENPQTPIQKPKTSQETSNNETSQQAKEYFQRLVNSLKDQINTNNGITYYTFLYELKNGCDENNTFTMETLLNAFKSIGLNIPQNDLKNFFNLLDFSETGKISLNDVINTIADPILDHRKYYIVNKFAKFDTEKKGEVPIVLLKKEYNPRGHPDVISGKISEEEAFKQFCFTLDIYCGIRMIKDIINYKQFVEYYNGISSSILDENYFIDILNGVWGDENIINNNQPNQSNQNNNSFTNININNNLNPNMEFNRRYRGQNQNNAPLKYNDSYADSNLGINSLLLGESSHILPKSFGKKSFKKYKTNFSQQDLNDIKITSNINKQNIDEQTNNNTTQDDISKNNYTNRQIYNKSSIFQNSDLNQLGNINNNNYDLNNYNRNNRNKFTYNPITNEYTPVNVSNINIKNIKIKTPLNEQNSQISNTQENTNKEHSTINSLTKLKNIFYNKGSQFIFSFLRRLSLYDFNHSGMISLENFLFISSSLNINIPYEELQTIFNFFDKENTGLINYNDLILTILGQINPNRESAIKKIYEKFKKDDNGNVSLNEIKLLLNASNHPDVLNNIKSRGQIYGEFLDNIETYKEYLENMRGIYINNFNLEDFVNFYNLLGVGVKDDKIFEFMINNCWNGENIEMNMNKYDNAAYGNGKSESNRIIQGNLMARAGSQIVNNIY